MLTADTDSKVYHKRALTLKMFLSDEGPMLETLNFTIRIGSTPTFLYFVVCCVGRVEIQIEI